MSQAVNYWPAERGGRKEPLKNAESSRVAMGHSHPECFMEINTETWVSCARSSARSRLHQAALPSL